MGKGGTLHNGNGRQLASTLGKPIMKNYKMQQMVPLTFQNPITAVSEKRMQ
jgi:hypothetical protein